MDRMISIKAMTMNNSFIVYWSTLIMDYYVKLFIKSNRSGKSKKTVCLVKVDGIGDALVWLSSFQALYQYYKDLNCDIILICAAPCKVFFEESFELLELIEINTREFYHFKYRYEMLKKIRRLPMDVIINCLYSRTISVDSIIRISPAEHKLGNRGDTVNTPGHIKCLTDRIYSDLAPQTNEVNEMSRNKNLLQWLGIKGYRESITPLPASFSTGRVMDEEYFVVFPGASSFRRCWPVERYAECCNRILEKRNWKLIICGGKAETSICGDLLNQIKEKDRAIDLAGQTSIKQLSSLISESKFVLTNDTSAVHFAMAWKIPNLCIAKGCYLGRFIPYHSNVIADNKIIESVVYSNETCNGNNKSKCDSSNDVYSCIKEITTGTVMKEIDAILEKIGE